MAPNNDACAIVENSIAIANDRKGSLAALLVYISRMSAIGGKADVKNVGNT